MVKPELDIARLAAKHLFEMAGANAVLVPWDPLRKDLYFEGRTKQDIAKAMLTDFCEVASGTIGYLSDMARLTQLDNQDYAFEDEKNAVKRITPNLTLHNVNWGSAFSLNALLPKSTLFTGRGKKILHQFIAIRCHAHFRKHSESLGDRKFFALDSFAKIMRRLQYRLSGMFR